MTNDSKIVTPSATNTLAKVSGVEKRKRYEELRKKMGASRLAVVGKTGMHYLWANAFESNELSRLDSLGYSLVRELKAAEVLAGNAQPEVRANGLQENGTYKLGDVILMQCTEETYEFLMLKVSEDQELLVRGASEGFLNEAFNSGVPTFERSK